MWVKTKLKSYKMNTFPIEVFDKEFDSPMFEVSKEELDDESPVYTVHPQDYNPKFKVVKTAQGWRQIPPYGEEKLNQRFIDEVGGQIESEEPEDFDPYYDEEAELDAMGLSDPETEKGYDWNPED